MIRLCLLLCFVGSALCGGGWGPSAINDPNALNLLDDFYFPSSVLRAEDLELVKVEHQIVSGINYRMTFNVVGTNSQCVVTIYEQSWTQTRQVLSDTCTAVAGSRGDNVAVPFTGAWGPSDINDPNVNDVLFDFYFPSSGLRSSQLELVKVEHQIVSGINYRMTFNVVGTNSQCVVKIWEQSWTQSRRVLSDTCTALAGSRAKRGMAGGWFETEEPSESALALLEEFYFPSSVLRAEDLELVRVEQQVVAGMNYRYHFNVVGTNSQCQVTVFDQWWTETREILLDTCTSVAGSRGDDVAVPFLDGGWEEANTNDLEVSSLLEEVYYPQSVGKEYLTLLKVERQVVSGTNYKYTFMIGHHGVTCYAIVYSQPWTNTQKVLVDTCLM